MSTFDIADEHEFSQKVALYEMLIEFQISINFSLSVETFPSVHRVENLQILSLLWTGKDVFFVQRKLMEVTDWLQSIL